ncbi:MAG TPA: aminotransferase class I/II-fold pyridoxal phosphate-dependent enzyme [Bacillus sp. (in: firmicutes)]|nr:aminotransferase class I/II-fold pyridoxal phosphate-dependent enzyme [Bacillus sp. (in: firmicutes)]
MNQSKTPLFTKLQEHHLRQTISFHVPGHKNGKVFPEMSNTLFSSILNIDVTELRGLDDLHDPEDIIAESQYLAANLYGVDKTYFLVNGSTVGNLASILSTVSSNDIVIVQRDCHKSVLNALKMANARPIFIAPDYDEKSNVCTGANQEDVIKAIEQYPSAKAVILTNPNYYGIARDLKGVIECAHRHQIIVIVDEAHGAHFILGDPFPPSAVQAGADLVIQSAHKTLPAMTMGSYLHVQGTLINMERLEFYLRALQSSSPSYPLMASLDLARFYLAQLKSEKKQIRSLVRSLTQFEERLNEMEGIKVVFPLDPYIKKDPLKVMIQPVHPFVKTGYGLQRQLESQQIYSELADLFHVLLVLPLSEQFPFEQSLQKMKTALEKATNNETSPDMNQIRPFHFQNTVLAISYEEMDLLKRRTLPFKEAIGRVAALPIIPYPPGIPILLEGELIESRHISYISRLQELGAKIQGGQGLRNQQLEVFLI